MATIQIRRQLKFSHPKAEALNYIKTKLSMATGEPLLCTYRESNGKWGSIECICVYPKGTNRSNTILTNTSYDAMFDANSVLIENIIKVNADENEWEQI